MNGITLAGRILLTALLATPAFAQVPEVRACWLTQYAYLGKSDPQLRQIAQDLVAGGVNTVYVAVYSGAQTLWPSQAYAAAGGSWTSNSVDWADKLVDLFHEEGLRVGAWFEYGLAVGPASHPLASAHPDWLARDQTGDPVTGENGGFVFLSPGHPAATDMIVEMARELAANYAFDDIQLDRIRWGRKSVGREYGYEAVTAALYQSTYGAPPPSNVNDATWVQFREGLVNDLMKRCHDAIEAESAEIVVSAAPTGHYGITQHMQRWRDWLDQGSVDLVMPQMYKTSLSSFQAEFAAHLAEAGPHVARLGVGYRASEANDHLLVKSQLDHARAQGVPHACLWVYHYYTAVSAIQDELDHLPLPGGPWQAPAKNPFTSDDAVTLVVDDADGAPAYVEFGAWSTSSQPDFFRFGSRVAPDVLPSSASFAAAVPRTGIYEVFAWYTSAPNRHPAAPVEIHHVGGVTVVPVDQRVGGGAWVGLGRFLFVEGALATRVRVTNAGSPAGAFTAADAVKLVFRPAGAAPLRLAPLGGVDLAATAVPGAQSIGTHPSAVAWDGKDLVVAGFNGGQGQKDVGLIRVTDALGAATLGAAFGLLKAPPQRGYSGLDVAGGVVAAAYDDGADDPEGVTAWSAAGQKLWSRSARGSSGVAFDPGFPGGNAAFGAGVAWTTFGADRRALQDAATGADVWSTLTGFSIDGGVGTFWRDVDFEDATGDAWLREGNNLLLARRSGDNATAQVDLVVPSTPEADLVNGQNVAALGDGTALYNHRASTGTGQPFMDVFRAADSTGAVLEIDWSGFAAAPGNGYYDVSFDPASGTVAILDFWNRRVDLFQVEAAAVVPYGVGCPGAGGVVPVLGMIGDVIAGGQVAVTVTGGAPFAGAYLVFGLARGAAPLAPGCDLLVQPLLPTVVGPIPLDAAGERLLSSFLPAASSGAAFTLQALIADAGAPAGLSATNGLDVDVP